MADTKTSALPTLTGANVASGDIIPIDDISATTLKGITAAELALGLGGRRVPHVSATWYSLAAELTMSDRYTTGIDSTAGRIWLMYLPYVRGALEGLGIEVTTAGEAGSKIRLGAYAVAAGGGVGASYDALVGANLADSGQLAADTTGFKSVTGLSVAIPAEGLWLSYVGQSFATTAPTVKCIDYNNAAYGPAANASSTDYRGGAIATTGATGALPGSLTGFVNGVGGLGWILPAIEMRFA